MDTSYFIEKIRQEYVLYYKKYWKIQKIFTFYNIKKKKIK